MIAVPEPKRLILPNDRRWRQLPEARAKTSSCCCPPPANCCNCLTSGTTYHITFGNSGHCPTFDGLTFALPWNTSCQWRTTVVCGSDTYVIQWTCTGLASSCNNMNLTVEDITQTGKCTGTGNPTACTCSPVNFTYSLSMGSLCTTGSCANVNSYTLTATITA